MTERTISDQIRSTNELPEFTREIPGDEALNQLVSDFSANRVQLLERAEDLGLNRDFLAAQQHVMIGPFVSPGPITTTFAGEVNNFVTSVALGRNIATQLKQAGYGTYRNLLVLLSMGEIPPRTGTGGAEITSECLVVPKNKQENQRLFIAGNPRNAQAYAATTLDRNDLETSIAAVKESFSPYMTRVQQLKRKKDEQKVGQLLLDSLISDFTTAFVKANGTTDQDNTVSYLCFVTNLNYRIASRVFPDINLLISSVDTEIYAPFLRNGIDSITKLVRTLDSVDFFNGNPGFVKVVGENGIVRILKLEDIGDNDILLKFTDDQCTITFSELKASNADIAPCKELSYIMCFGNIASVIYGSINTDGYYQPYNTAQRQVTELGLKPILYRIQPPISNRYGDQKTVFDFYQQVLFPYGFS